MNIELKARRVAIRPRMIEHVDKRLSLALDRFSRDIRGAVVRIERSSGESPAFSASVQISLVDGGRVLVTERHSEWETAIDLASDRARHALSRGLGRRRVLTRSRDPIPWMTPVKDANA